MPNTSLLTSSSAKFGGLLQFLGVAAILLAALRPSPLTAQGLPFGFSPYLFITSPLAVVTASFPGLSSAPRNPAIRHSLDGGNSF